MIKADKNTVIHTDYEINKPNAITLKAMAEAKRLIHNHALKRYTDVEEALLELKK